VILFSKTATKGFSIDYPTVALHALGSQGGQAAVYLQLDLHDKELTNDDDDIQTLTLNLIPQATTSTVENGATNGHAEGGDTNGASAPNSSAAKALFEALSACADLNPDPMDEDDEDEGGVDMLEPGAGGWITSENMHEFMDENGNWTGPQIPMLGAGAGQVRSREEADGEDAAEGANSEDEETKWRRTG
jgi:nucleotide-sensitive chloride channel 1A